MLAATELINNFPLMMAISGWLAAQLLKCLFAWIFYRDDLTFHRLFASGGMPSSHTATVCALTTAFALTDGFSSPFFAVSAVLSFIIMYDATGVRRSAGEQAQTLNKIILHLFDQQQIPIDKTVREIFGHTPFQVLVGAVIGITLPLAVRFSL